MALELPIVSAILARLPDPESNLAAWGGIIFPVAFIVEAPIVMLLAASTALSKDWQSFLRLRRYMMIASASLTLLHFFIAFTPLYDEVVIRLIAPPPEIIEPGRIGLRIMLPWTWSIAYRRFHQGVLIRFGHSEAVGWGTAVRLLADTSVLLLGYCMGNLPGIVVAASAVACGVVSEALFAGIRVRPVLRHQVRSAKPVESPLTLHSFLDFYLPLAMTSILSVIIQPLGSAALSRMPLALESLAIWPVISGLIFMFRSMGLAYNEVMVALLDETHAYENLRRFAILLMGLTTVLLALVVVTPLKDVWFVRISGLEPKLASLGRAALWFTLPIPALAVLQSFYQGIILHGKRTRGITESVAVFLLVAVLILLGGLIWGEAPGIHVVWVAFGLGYLLQGFFLWLRARPTIVMIRLRDAR
jgi:hypothetical protein